LGSDERICLELLECLPLSLLQMNDVGFKICDQSNQSINSFPVAIGEFSDVIGQQGQALCRGGDRSKVSVRPNQLDYVDMAWFRRRGSNSSSRL